MVISQEVQQHRSDTVRPEVPGKASSLLGWQVCRTKLARKIFVKTRIFSQKMLRNCPRNFTAFILCVRKKNPAKFQAAISRKISLPKIKNNRQASAGAPGEIILKAMRHCQEAALLNSGTQSFPEIQGGQEAPSTTKILITFPLWLCDLCDRATTLSTTCAQWLFESAIQSDLLSRHYGESTLANA